MKNLPNVSRLQISSDLATLLSRSKKVSSESGFGSKQPGVGVRPSRTLRS